MSHHPHAKADALSPAAENPVSHSLYLLLGDRVEPNDRTLLEGVAEYYLLLGRTAEGVQCLQEAKNLHRKKFDFKGDARVLRKLGGVHQQRGEKAEALRSLQQAMHASRDMEDPAGEAAALDMMAGMLAAEQRYPEAIKSYEDTVRLREQCGDHVGQAHSLTSLGHTCAAVGKQPEALRAYRQALKIWKTQGLREQECHCLLSIVETYLALGRFGDLINTASEVVQVAEAASLKMPRSPLYLHVGMAWRSLGEFEHGATALTHALESARREKAKLRLIISSLVLGRTLRDWGRAADALKVLHHAEAESKEGDARHMVGEVMLDRGIAMLVAGQHADAHKLLQEAARSLAALNHDDRAAEAWFYAANAGLRSDGAADAEACLVKAHGLAQTAGDSHLLSVIYSFRGTALWHLGRPDEALKWFKAALELVDDAACVGRTAEENLLGASVRPFEGVVELSVASGDHPAAFAAALKAQAYRCVLQAERLVLPDKTANGTGSVGQCERLLAQIKGCNVQLQTEYDPVRRRLLFEQVAQLRTELHKHAITAESHHPEYAPLRFILPLDIADVQKTLDPKTAVLAYMVTGRQTFLWIVTRQDVSPFSFAAGRPALTRLVDDLLACLQQRVDLARLMEASRAVTAAVLDGVWDLLHGFERLLVVPDDALNRVPFGVLLAPEGGFLSQHWELAAAPSLQLLKNCHSRGRHASRRGGGRKSEVRMATRGLLGGHGPSGPLAASTTSELEGVEAPPTVTLTELGSKHRLADVEVLFRKAGLLHVVSPLNIVPAAFYQSGFALADGSFSLHELARYNFTATVVLVSALTPPLPEGSGGEWTSLLLPFVYAGLPALVFNRWPVADAARKYFADCLLSALQHDTSKAAAVRYAQAQLMNQPQFSHPHFWSTFELAGDWA